MKPQESDYVICRSVDNPKKNFMGRVIKLRKDSFVVLDENKAHYEPNNVEVEFDQLILNLGATPPVGTILGFDTNNLYRRSKEHDIWGSIHYFRKVHKELGQSLTGALDKTGEKLVKLGFEKVFDKFVTEVRQPHGKHAGMYIYVTDKKKDVPSHLQLFLKDDHSAEMRYVLYHEFGHAIRKHCLNTPNVHAAWTKIFRTSVLNKPIEAPVFKRLLKAIVSVDAEEAKTYSIAELINSTEEEDLLAFKVAARYINQVYHISTRDFRSLITAGKFELVKSVWPTTTIDVDDLKPIVSEYACTNMEELFAESFSHHLTGKKLPKNVTELLEKHLAIAKDAAKTLDIKEE